MNCVKYLSTASMFSSEQSGDMKHDSSSSPGISDQEKEMAISAFQAFKVNETYSHTRAGVFIVFVVVVDKLCFVLFVG